MLTLLQLVFVALARFYLPIWYRYPTTTIMFRLRDRQRFWQWVIIACAAWPVSLAILYGAGGAYQATGIIAFGFIAAIAGMSWIKLLVMIPTLLIRHAVLTVRERRVAAGAPARA